MEDGFNDTVIDGYSGFIFSSRYGEALVRIVSIELLNEYAEITMLRKRYVLSKKSERRSSPAAFFMPQPKAYILHSFFARERERSQGYSGNHGACGYHDNNEYLQ